MVISFPSSSFLGFIIIVAFLTFDVEKAAIIPGRLCGSLLRPYGNNRGTGPTRHLPDILQVVDDALRMRRDIMGMKKACWLVGDV